MLPKNQRIPREMFRLLNGAKVFKNKLFLLRFVSYNGSNRFCFSVSKKIARSAVIRNRMRRTGYRLLKNFIPQIKPHTLATFSFLTAFKDEKELLLMLEFVLKDSKLID